MNPQEIPGLFISEYQSPTLSDIQLPVETFQQCAVINSGSGARKEPYPIPRFPQNIYD